MYKCVHVSVTVLVFCLLCCMLWTSVILVVQFLCAVVTEGILFLSAIYDGRSYCVCEKFIFSCDVICYTVI